MLQLSAHNHQAARAKITSLPTGSWGVVKVTNERRMLLFSICGDDIQTFSYGEDSFKRCYTPALAAVLKNHAAKPPVDKEQQRKKYLQQYNTVNEQLDAPTAPTDAAAVPDAPSKY